MAAAQRAAATNGPDPDPGPDPGTGAGFCQSTVSILDNHALDNHVWTFQIVIVIVVQQLQNHGASAAVQAFRT